MNFKNRIENTIRSIKNPHTGQDLLATGVVQNVTAEGDSVIVLMEVDSQQAAEMEGVRKSLEQKLAGVKGVKKARVVMTAVKKAGEGAPPPNLNQGHSHGPSQSGPKPPTPKPLKGVRHVIAVGSGKGGVGKSTTSVNLAYALQSLGLKTGLVDCDIFGPSASVLLGVKEQPKFDDDDMIIPIEKNGLKAMSMSNIIDADKAAIWRGPMVIKAVQQLLAGTNWGIDGDLDVLIADLPPGTGDVQLTMAQTAEVSGAVIVSTPQDLALIDARKAYDMFEKTNTPVFGIVENMSYFLCPHCGERSDIFGHGGARDTAKDKDLPFLGEIPLHMDIREGSDAGNPIVVSDPESPLAEAYFRIARQLAGTLMLVSV